MLIALHKNATTTPATRVALRNATPAAGPFDALVRWQCTCIATALRTPGMGSCQAAWPNFLNFLLNLAPCL